MTAIAAAPQPRRRRWAAAIASHDREPASRANAPTRSRDRDAARPRRRRGGSRVRRAACRPIVAGIVAARRSRRARRRSRRFARRGGEALDQGLALYFPAPRSYTGEDVLELHGHGGPAVLRLLLARCVELGARLARPGEFTQRAFLNGKLDLAQAESVADLIDAATATAARAAARSLSGAFSREIRALVDALIELRMFTEATLDFPEEDIEFLRAADARGRLARSSGRRLARCPGPGEAGRAPARRSHRRARRPAERRQVEPPQSARRRRGRDRHADRGHDARCAAIADRDSRHSAHRSSTRRGCGRRTIRSRRWASSARGRRSGDADLALVLVDAAAGDGIADADAAILAELPAALRRLVVHNKIDLAGLPAGVETRATAAPGDTPGGAGRHVFLSAKTGAGHRPPAATRFSRIAGAHEDMEGDVPRARAPPRRPARRRGRHLAAAEATLACAEARRSSSSPRSCARRTRRSARSPASSRRTTCSA